LKIANISQPCVFLAPAEWIPLELDNTGWPQETGMRELPRSKRSMIIYLFFSHLEFFG